MNWKRTREELEGGLAETQHVHGEGANGIRTGSGLFLGIAYSLGLWMLLVDAVIWVVLVGLGYGGVTTVLLVRMHEVASFAEESS